MSSEPSQVLYISEGTDPIVPDGVQLPYKLRSNLGSGQSGTVAEVEDIYTGRRFAQKTLHFRWARDKIARERDFKNEVEIIRGLGQHHHIIQVFATYLAKREFGLILHPVADSGNLDDFLGVYTDKLNEVTASHVPEPATNQELSAMTAVLEQAFGCLASGLSFIHQQRVRHKDVKPENILVHRGRIIFTDFGYSLDCSQMSGSTTEGPPGGKTKRYAAPEVLAYEPPEPRNSASDVFSLGCVFIEIFSALTQTVDTNNVKRFADDLAHLHKELSEAKPPVRLAFLPGMIITMTLQNAQSRWKAIRALKETFDHPGFYCCDCGATVPKGDVSLKTINDIDTMTVANTMLNTGATSHVLHKTNVMTRTQDKDKPAVEPTSGTTSSSNPASVHNENKAMDRDTLLSSLNAITGSSTKALPSPDQLHKQTTQLSRRQINLDTVQQNLSNSDLEVDRNSEVALPIGAHLSQQLEKACSSMRYALRLLDMPIAISKSFDSEDNSNIVALIKQSTEINTEGANHTNAANKIMHRPVVDMAEKSLEKTIYRAQDTERCEPQNLNSGHWSPSVSAPFIEPACEDQTKAVCGQQHQTIHTSTSQENLTALREKLRHQRCKLREIRLHAASKAGVAFDLMKRYLLMENFELPQYLQSAIDSAEILRDQLGIAEFDFLDAENRYELVERDLMKRNADLTDIMDVEKTLGADPEVVTQGILGSGAIASWLNDASLDWVDSYIMEDSPVDTLHIHLPEGGVKADEETYAYDDCGNQTRVSQSSSPLSESQQSPLLGHEPRTSSPCQSWIDIRRRIDQWVFEMLESSSLQKSLLSNMYLNSSIGAIDETSWFNLVAQYWSTNGSELNAYHTGDTTIDTNSDTTVEGPTISASSFNRDFDDLENSSHSNSAGHEDRANFDHPVVKDDRIIDAFESTTIPAKIAYRDLDKAFRHTWSASGLSLSTLPTTLTLSEQGPSSISSFDECCSRASSVLSSSMHNRKRLVPCKDDFQSRKGKDAKHTTIGTIHQPLTPYIVVRGPEVWRLPLLRLTPFPSFCKNMRPLTDLPFVSHVGSPTRLPGPVDFSYDIFT